MPISKRMKTWAVLLLLVAVGGTIRGLGAEDRPVADKDPKKAVTKPLLVLGDTRFKHDDEVTSITFSPDGKRLASAGGYYDKTVKVWDVASGKEILTSEGRTERILGMGFSPDGKRLTIAGHSPRGIVKVWDAAGDRPILTLKHNNTVRSISGVFSPDGKRLATRDLNGEMVWDTTNGEKILTLNGRVGIATFSPDGKRMAGYGNDGRLWVWDAASGEKILTLEGHSDHAGCLAFSPDGKRLAAAGTNSVFDRKSRGLKRTGVVKVWDAASGKKLVEAVVAAETDTLKGHRETVGYVAFSPDGKHLAGGSHGMVRVWDAVSGKEIVKVTGLGGWCRKVAFSPDGKRLAGTVNHMVRFWDPTTGKEILPLQGHSWQVRSVAFSPDGKRVASASYDRTVKVWDAASGKEILTFMDEEMAYSVAFSPDGKRLAGGGNKTVKIWDIDKWRAREVSPPILTIQAHNRGVLKVAFSADGKRLLSVGEYEGVKIWDAASGKKISSLKVDHCLAFSPDGDRLASASFSVAEGFSTNVWDAARGKQILSLKDGVWPDYRKEAAARGYEFPHRKREASEVTSAAFSADGKRLASASVERVKVWDAATGKEIGSIEGNMSGVKCLAFSPDGERVAGAGFYDSNKIVKIWDVASGKEILILKGHTREVHSVAFSPDGKRLVSGGEDARVLIWDVSGGQ